MGDQQDLNVPDVIGCVVDHIQHGDEEAVDDSEQVIKSVDAANVSVGVDHCLEGVHEGYHENHIDDAEVQKVPKDALDGDDEATD